MANGRYDIRVYNTSNILLRTLAPGSVQAARYRVAENEVGDFEVTVAWGNGSVPELLSPPNRVEFWRDGVWVFGGIIRRQMVRQEGKAPFYTISGPSYMQWLADARMRPATGTGDIAYSSDKLDDTMKLVVTQQVRDLNDSFVVAADSSLSAVTEAYTATAYETVLETLQNIATRAKDTTFDIIRDTDNALRFRTWTPSRGPDKSKGTNSPVLFDLRGGNLIDAEWVRDGNQVVNALWGGGPGDKAARYIWPAGDALKNAQSILDWGRIEGFIDAGTEGTAAVEKKVIEELDKVSLADESVSFKIAPFGRYRLGEDFDYQTKVTVVWQDVLEFTDVIRGMEVRLDAGSSVAQVDINVGDTLTGDTQTKASIILGRYLRVLKRQIGVQTRH
jgi:hypothetical protein